MNSNTPPANGLLSVRSIRQYLLATGWDKGIHPQTEGPEKAPSSLLLKNRRMPERQIIEAFRSTSAEWSDVEIILPTFQRSADYDYLVRNAVNILSDVENRPVADVIQSIIARGADIIRSRIPDTMTMNDSIRLEAARNFISGIRDVLAATATTELDPEPFFLRVKKEGANFADQCRFGHTFHGSFGFTIESPVSDNREPTLGEIEENMPFERRVISRFARGIQDVAKAASRQDPSEISKNAIAGFNANICEQFADLVESTSVSGMVFDVAFSPEWKAPQDIVQTRFEVGLPHVEITRAAAKLLRTEVKARDETVAGRIVRLESEADPSDVENALGKREVALAWSSEREGDIHVRASLSPAEYLRAVAAHGKGKAIELEGTLEKKGRGWVLTSPSNLRVLGED